MSGERKQSVESLQGTLDLIVLRTLQTMGPMHAYAIASRLEQLAEPDFVLNQGTLYPGLVRLEQRGWIKGAWVENREQSRGEVLRHHEVRRTRAPERDRKMAAHRPCREAPDENA